MPTLNWIGKEKIVTHHEDVPFRVLDHKYGFTAAGGRQDAPTRSGNMIIHGDNLVALKSLLPMYEGRIDCVYIDPPYNTGNESWVYNDNVNDPHIRKWLNEVVGRQGEDLSRHDKWLCMMYPRLALLHKLLSPTGAIFISIDDNELAPLRLLMDELFGQNCFVSYLVWEKAYSTRNDSKGIPEVTDHILVYSKEPNWQPNKLERTEEMDSKYQNPDNDFAPWTSSDAFASDARTHQGMVYAIQHPFTGDLIYPYNSAHWRYQQQEMLEIMNGWCGYELRDIDDAERRAAVCGVAASEVREGVMAIMLKEDLETSRQKAQAVYDRGQWPRFYFTGGGKGGIRRKTYLTNVEGKLASSLWKHDEAGHTDGAKKELKAIFGGNIPFDTPKPVSLIERILQIATNDYSTVLDSFAGSGTTAHAVMKMNKESGASHRKFILVELEDYADTTTAERVRRVAQGYKYKGKKEEEIYSKKLTPKNILQADKLLKEAEAAAEAAKGDYDKIGKPAIKDNCLKVTATKVYDGEMPGLGGAFDFYELGEPLFDDDGFLNEDVGEEKIRQYIFYSETGQPMQEDCREVSPYLLGNYNRTDYYFYYDPTAETCLSTETAQLIARQAEQYVVYADTCLFSKEELSQRHIVFKKIPRDIKRF